MATNTQVVSGFIVRPNGTSFTGGIIRFTLNRIDTDGSEVITHNEYVEFPIAADGSMAAELWPNSLGTNASKYIVQVKETNDFESIGVIQVSNSGPYDLAELIRQYVPVAGNTFYTVLTRAEFETVNSDRLAIEAIANSTIMRATYLFSGTGVNSTLTLPLTPANIQQLTVVVNGVVIPRALLALSGATLSVDSAVNWPEGVDNIEISFDGISTLTQNNMGDGSASSPGLAFASDVDTGIFRPAANQIGFSAQGTRRALLSTTAFQLDVNLTGTALMADPMDDTNGKLMDVGAFGLGATDLAQVRFDNGETNLPSGFYSGGGGSASAATFPNANARYAPFLNLTRRVTTGDYSQTRIFFGSDGPVILTRDTLAEAWTIDHEVLSKESVLADGLIAGDTSVVGDLSVSGNVDLDGNITIDDWLRVNEIRAGDNPDPLNGAGAGEKATLMLSGVNSTAFGDGVLSSALGFSGTGTSRRRAMIAAFQDGADGDPHGLEFFTYSSNNTGNDGVGSRGKIRSDGELEWESSISSASSIIAGAGSGAVALTVNDGYGNANLTFNHANGIPDVLGNGGRIVVNTDQTSGPKMTFQLGSAVTAGVEYSTTPKMELDSNGLEVFGDLDVSGNVSLPDTSELRLGTGDDLVAFHNGSNGYFDNITGATFIRNHATDGVIRISSDDGTGTGVVDYFRANGGNGEASMSHYGVEKINTTLTGADITGDLNVSGKIDLATNNNGGTSLNVLSFSDGDGSTAAGQPMGRVSFKNNDGSVLSEAAYIESRAVSATGNGEIVFGTGPKGTPTDKMVVQADGDLELLTTGKGVIMRSPDGTAYVLTIANGGTVTVTAV